VKRWLSASGVVVAAIFVPFEALGGQIAEAAAWAMRFIGSRRPTDDAVEDETGQVPS
jgi:hypothetical protein